MIGMKTCTRCSAIKDPSEFHKGKGPDGRQPYCRTCSTAYKRALRHKDPDKARAYGRKLREKAQTIPEQHAKMKARALRYYYANHEACLARNADYRKRHPRAQQALNLRTKYGLTLEQFDEMVERQAGLCAICTEPMQPGTNTHVDHDHRTRAIRGLLCGNCNRMLGCAQDNSGILAAGISYLEGVAACEKSKKSS